MTSLHSTESRRHWRPITRPGAAVYLLLFLGLTATVRHDHLNALADLSSDGPSDCGFFLKANAPGPTRGAAAIGSCDVVRDLACLACFFSDVTATAPRILAVVLEPSIFRLPYDLPAAPPAAMDLPPRAGRGPPLL